MAYQYNVLSSEWPAELRRKRRRNMVTTPISPEGDSSSAGGSSMAGLPYSIDDNGYYLIDGTIRVAGDIIASAVGLDSKSSIGLLNDLEDVDTSAKLDGYVLTYSSSIGSWRALAPTGGSGVGTVSWDSVIDKPAFATVATSGSYFDLSNKPTAADIGAAPSSTVSFPGFVASGTSSTTLAVRGDDSRLSNSRTASDVSAWAKAATKPNYTAAEVGAAPSSTVTFPGFVASGASSTTLAVRGDDSRLSNSRTASDVSAWAKAATKPNYTAAEVGAAPSSTVTFPGFVASGASSTTLAVRGDDSRLSNSRTASDVSAWAKAATKPSYTAGELGVLSTAGGTMINFSAINFYRTANRIYSGNGDDLALRGSDGVSVVAADWIYLASSAQNSYINLEGGDLTASINNDVLIATGKSGYGGMILTGGDFRCSGDIIAYGGSSVLSAASDDPAFVETSNETPDYVAILIDKINKLEQHINKLEQDINRFGNGTNRE